MTTIEKENKITEIIKDLQSKNVDLYGFSLLYHKESNEILYKNLSIGKTQQPNIEAIIGNINDWSKLVYAIQISIQIEHSNIIAEKRFGSPTISLFR